MKLSMSLIANELSGTVNDIHIYADSGAKVSAIRILYDNDTSLDSEYVYLCQPLQLHTLIEQGADLENQNLIVYGNDSSTLKESLTNCNYLFISETSSFFYFINMMEAIFSSYNEWENKLIAMSVSQDSLQDMLDLAFSKIRIPLCMLDVNHQVVAVNQQVNTSDALYNYMQQGYGYPCIDIINASNPTLPELDKDTVQEVINTISHNRLRVTTIRARGHSVFYLGLHKSDDQPFSPHTLELYETFIQILTAKVALLPENVIVKSSLFEQFMTDLILNKDLDQTIIEQLIEHFNYEQFDDYSLFTVQFMTPLTRRSVKLPEFMSLVESSIPNSKCFYLEPYVGILVCKTVAPADIQRFKNVLHTWQAHCAQSSCFRDLCDIRQVWKQMLFILDNWIDSEEEIQNYDRYITDHCVQTIQQKLPPETLYHPYFIRLLEYDRENNTEYLATLVSYLQNNCSISATANALYIHRNSLQYRIKKIEELLDIKIATSEERFNMLFSSFFIS